MEIYSFETLEEAKSDILICPLFTDKEIDYDENLKELIRETKSNFSFEPKYKKQLIVPSNNKVSAKAVLFLGFGNSEEINDIKIRTTFAKALQTCKNYPVHTSLSVIPYNREFIKPMLEGILLANYEFNKYKTDSEMKQHINKVSIIFNEDITDILEFVSVEVQAVDFARNLINEPGSYMTPEMLVKIAKQYDKVKATIYDKGKIEKLGMGAFLAVGRGGKNEPKLIHLQYKPRKATRKIALVGKGITFDSGGLDIKPAASMKNMHGDMAGAASVLAIFNALEILKPNIEVHGIIAACENMSGCDAYKPGDILTAMNGKTIEVDNTDAEGRLTLADALCYAEKLQVDEIIDIATLTGACCVALGTVASGLFSNDKLLAERLKTSADIAGEYLWELPMYEEYFDDMKSDVADFKNSGGRYGGASSAALFLQKFVNNTPWAHIDIAGTSIIPKEFKELKKGPTGVGIRTLLTYIMEYADKVE